MDVPALDCLVILRQVNDSFYKSRGFENEKTNTVFCILIKLGESDESFFCRNVINDWC